MCAYTFNTMDFNFVKMNWNKRTLDNTSKFLKLTKHILKVQSLYVLDSLKGGITFFLVP